MGLDISVGRHGGCLNGGVEGALSTWILFERSSVRGLSHVAAANVGVQWSVRDRVPSSIVGIRVAVSLGNFVTSLAYTFRLKES